MRIERWCPRCVWVIALAAAAGCAKNLPPDSTPEELYAYGVDRFEHRKFTKAIEALQRFMFQDPGHPKADSAQYLIAEAYYQQKQFLTAASEFLRLAQNRPAGALADDSRLRVCEAYAQLSPRPELDQEFTREAIDQCRSLILLYPSSPFVLQANERLQTLVDKLARKVYLNAKYYYQRKAYDSAIVYLEHLMERYTNAEVMPEALLTLFRSYVRLGYVQEAEEVRSRLMQEYPDSKQAREVEKSSAKDAA